SWPSDRKCEFLQDYSWSHRQMGPLLRKHPTARRLVEYLAGQAPRANGPHVLWGKTSADIWKGSSNNWQAWTWEIRCTSIPAAPLKYWTCPTHIHEDIQAIAEDDARNVDWYEELNRRYVAGGISQL